MLGLHKEKQGASVAGCHEQEGDWEKIRSQMQTQVRSFRIGGHDKDFEFCTKCNGKLSES